MFYESCAFASLDFPSSDRISLFACGWTWRPVRPGRKWVRKTKKKRDKRSLSRSIRARLLPNSALLASLNVLLFEFTSDLRSGQEWRERGNTHRGFLNACQPVKTQTTSASQLCHWLITQSWAPVAWLLLSLQGDLDLLGHDANEVQGRCWNLEPTPQRMAACPQCSGIQSRIQRWVLGWHENGDGSPSAGLHLTNSKVRISKLKLRLQMRVPLSS